MSHDYPKIVAQQTTTLKSVEGQTLERVLVNAVDHEFNVLYLKFGPGWFAANGAIGGEVLVFQKCDKPLESAAGEASFSRTFPFAPFDIFLNNKVIATRQIGEAWNGHGFEFTFSGFFDKTLIVQSIYAGEKIDGFNDCIRLGFGTYFHDATAFG